MANKEKELTKELDRLHKESIECVDKIEAFYNSNPDMTDVYERRKINLLEQRIKTNERISKRIHKQIMSI